jgi:hypothetical protein
VKQTQNGPPGTVQRIATVWSCVLRERHKRDDRLPPVPM